MEDELVFRVFRMEPLSCFSATAELTDVLAVAEITMIRPFVVELRKDTAAVQAALQLPWTTSPVEGQVGRPKMLKRTMYGRASFRRLSARVLHAERSRRHHLICGRTQF